MKRALQFLLKSFKPLFLLSLLLISSGQTSFALSSEQRRAITGRGGSYFDVAVACASDPGSNGKIYVLGDSLTVGMRDQGDLKNKLRAESWQDIKIQATNGINIKDSLPKVDADQDFVKEASTAVVGLGTNPDDAPRDMINSMVAKLRGLNNQIRIYWINVYSSDDIPVRQENQQTVNRILNNRATELGFTVINWRSEAVANPSNYPFLADMLHHTPAGYQAKSAFVVDEVGPPPANLGGAGGSAGGAAGLVGDSPEEQIFNYLVGKQVAGQPLRDYHVAGILGNMNHESGYQPQRLQGTPSGTITPAAEARTSSLGWGLVQWTPAGKIINPLTDTGKDPDNMKDQLDFLLEQLNGQGPSPEGGAGQALIAARNVGEATLAFETKYERHAGSPQPTRITVAQGILDQGFAAGAAAGECGTAGDSDFESTVLNYAWPEYHPAPYLEAKEAYVNAIRDAQAAGQYVGGGSHPGIDCGGFVTRLMIDSGFEPEYNFGGVMADGASNVSGGQITWLQENWEKITVTGTQDLRPGDVAVNTGRTHTFVFVGDVDGGGFVKKIASASYGSWRAPMAGEEDLLASNIEWYRQR